MTRALSSAPGWSPAISKGHSSHRLTAAAVQPEAQAIANQSRSALRSQDGSLIGRGDLAAQCRPAFPDQKNQNPGNTCWVRDRSPRSDGPEASVV
jgi:hypothetical protein